MQIVVHLRPGEKDYYVKLVRLAYPKADLITVSDFKRSGDIWFGEYIYQARHLNIYFSADVIDDIYMRCRFLRSIKKETAEVLINNLAVGLDRFFSEHSVDAVVGGLIDCYTQDVLERVSSKHGIPYVSFVGHFFTGYCRISSRGELRKMPRSVSDEEIDAVYDQITQSSYKPSYKLNRPKSIADMYYYYGRELIKKHVYFPMRKLIDHDSMNYHLNTTLPDNWKFSSVIDSKIDCYFSLLKELPETFFQSCVYIPLHFTPEATLDYWADNPEFALQEKTILTIVRDAPANVKLLIKEHPAMYLRRHTDFYKQLRRYANVEILHPYESSNDVLARVENVMVFTGSVGVEALLRGKRVLSLSDNYYINLHPNIFKITKLTEDSLLSKLEFYPPKVFIRDILQGLFKARFFNDKTMFESDMSLMSKSLKEYLCEAM